MTVYDKHGQDVTITTSQVCSACHTDKPLAEYYFSPRNRGTGYSDICMLCVSASFNSTASHSFCDTSDNEKNSYSPSSSTSVQQLAKTLNYEHDQNGRSWRKIAKDFPGVKFGVLNRIANTNGRWTPKDAALRAALKLTAPREWLAQAARNLEQLENKI